MPFRLDPKYGEFRAKIQFTTAAWMPYKIYQACLATGVLSNTRYCQLAVCEKLARDLDLDLGGLIETLPRSRSVAAHLWNPAEALPGPKAKGRNIMADHSGGVARYGMGNTDEEVH